MTVLRQHTFCSLGLPLLGSGLWKLRGSCTATAPRRLPPLPRAACPRPLPVGRRGLGAAVAQQQGRLVGSGPRGLGGGKGRFEGVSRHHQGGLSQVQCCAFHLLRENRENGGLGGAASAQSGQVIMEGTHRHWLRLRVSLTNHPDSVQASSHPV